MVETQRADSVFIDFPELAERRHLIAHLLRNTSEAVYIRGLPGVGKTVFYQKLLDDLVIEFYIVRIRPGPHLNVLRTVQEAKQRAAVHEAVKPLLLAADDTDDLSEAALSALKTLHGEGARLLFCGRGRVVPQIGGSGLRLIDLPTMNLTQSEAFIERLDPARAAELGQNGRVDLYHETGGVPGKIIARIRSPNATPSSETKGKQSLIAWIGAVSLLAIVTVGLWQQDRINRLFEDTGVATEPAEHTGRPPHPASNVVPEVTALAPPTTPDVVVEYSRPDDQSKPASGVSLERPDFEQAKKKLLSAASAVPSKEQVPAKAKFELPDAVKPTAAIAQEAVDGPAPEPVLIPLAPPGQGESDESEAPQVEEPRVDDTTQAPPAEMPPEAVTKPATTSLAVKSEPAKPVVSRAGRPAATHDSLPGAAWLTAQPDADYTLQLMAGRSLKSLLKVVESNGISSDFAIVKKELKGAPWYALVYGSFADRKSANEEKSSLGSKIPKDAWPRRFREIR